MLEGVVGMRILNLLHVFYEYLKLFIIPYPLFMLRTIAPMSLNDFSLIMRLIFFLTFLVVLVIVFIRNKRYAPLFGMGWFIVSLSYFLRAMYKVNFRISIEEQWAYLASIGFFVVLAYFILSLKRKWLIVVLSSVLITTCCVASFFACGHWKNEIDFYRYSLKFAKDESLFILQFNLSRALYEKGRYEEAAGEMERVLAVDPNNWKAYILLGDVLKKSKKFSEAKAAYKKAAQIDYFCWQANIRLKKLTEELGEKYDDGIDPSLPPAEAKIVSLVRLGDFKEALKSLAEELRAHPTPQLFTLAGITFGKVGALNNAIEAFNAALKLDPNYSPAIYNLAIVYEKQFKPQKAAALMRRIQK